MPTRLNPYIGFEHEARPAMDFYQEIFGGEVASNTFGEFGETGEAADMVMHAMLETPGGFTLMASDTPPGMEAHGAGKPTISLSGEEADELRGYWEKLSDGGTVITPLARQTWGDEFGHCIDKYGVGWMVNIAGEA